MQLKLLSVLDVFFEFINEIYVCIYFIQRCYFQILCCENRKYLETVSAFDHPPARMIAARS
jgi:hypothetical protein